jgi:hypothetical protein
MDVKNKCNQRQKWKCITHLVAEEIVAALYCSRVAGESHEKSHRITSLMFDMNFSVWRDTSFVFIYSSYYS